MIAKKAPVSCACNIYSCPPFFFNLANPGSCRGPETIPSYRVAGYTSDRYPVCCKTNKERQITIRFHNQTCGQIRINSLPNMSVLWTDVGVIMQTEGKYLPYSFPLCSHIDEFWFFPLGVCDALSYVPSAEEPAVSGPVRQPSDGPDSGGDALWYNTNFEGHSSFKLQWKCSEGEVWNFNKICVTYKYSRILRIDDDKYFPSFMSSLCPPWADWSQSSLNWHTWILVGPVTASCPQAVLGLPPCDS